MPQIALRQADDGRSIAKLAEWPDSDLPKEEGTCDLTPQDINYHIVLARYLRGAPLAKSKRLITSINSGTRRRPKMLLAALQAVAEDNAKQFATNFKKYLDVYRKTEYRTNRIDFCISIEGTILWNVARRASVELPDLALEQTDMIVTPDTIQRGETK